MNNFIEEKKCYPKFSETLNLNIEDLQCVICYSYSTNYYGISICQHLVCIDCYYKLKNFTKCPYCNVEYNYNLYIEMKIINRIIRNINVNCQFENCNYTCKYIDYEKHYKTHNNKEEKLAIKNNTTNYDTIINPFILIDSVYV